MKILVTGSDGFIGQNLVTHLMSEGHGVAEYEYVENTVPDCSQFDRVIHMGAISSTTETDVEKVMKQNLDFSTKLLQVCDMQGVDLIYASSASVYGPTTHFTEDGDLLPVSPYAWSKYLFDRFLNQYLEEFNIKIQGFRYFNVYGPGEENKGDQASPYTKFTKQAKEDGVITLFEDSDKYLRDFVCVEDICRAHELMFDSDSTGIFNIGTGTATSFETVANAIATKHNAAIQYIPIPENIKAQYQKYTCANLTKLNNAIDMHWTSIEDYINGTN